MNPCATSTLSEWSQCGCCQALLQRRSGSYMGNYELVPDRSAFDAGQLCQWGLPVSCSPWVLISHCLWGPVGILGDLIGAPFLPPLGSQTGALVVYLHQPLVGAHKDTSSPCFAGDVHRFWTLPSSWFSLLFMGELKDVQYLFYPLDICLQWLQILSKSFNCREVFTNIQYFLWSYNTSNCE